VRPYSTWVSEDSSVVQEIVAPLVLMEDAEMDEMIGAVMSSGGGGGGGTGGGGGGDPGGVMTAPVSE
jgi:hypothetical protein